MDLCCTPAEITEKYAAVGACKAKRSTPMLILLGILAGALIALGSAATNTAVFELESVSMIKMICGLLFPFGLGMVVIMGAELFTGNCLISISVLDKRCTFLEMLRSWMVVYLANLVGSLLVAAGCAYFGQLDLGGGYLAVYTMKVAAAKCSIPFGNGVVLGILCNFLVCLGVLITMSAKDIPGKIMGAFLPVAYFVMCGFEHCVANMYYIPAGLMAKSIPTYAFYAQAIELDLSALTVQNFVFGNLIPVTIGNIIGGAGLGILMWVVHLHKTHPRPDSTK